MRAQRKDANHQAIVAALRKIGAEPSEPERAHCDLFVSFRQAWYALEIKDGAKPPSAQALTEAERIWTGKQKGPVYVVKSPYEAIELLKLLDGGGRC